MLSSAAVRTVSVGPLRFVATSHVFVNDWESAAGVAYIHTLLYVHTHVQMDVHTYVQMNIHTFLNRQIHTRGLCEQGGLAALEERDSEATYASWYQPTSYTVPSQELKPGEETGRSQISYLERCSPFPLC